MFRMSHCCCTLDVQLLNLYLNFLQIIVVAMVCMMTFFHMPKLDQPVITVRPVQGVTFGMPRSVLCSSGAGPKFCNRLSWITSRSASLKRARVCAQAWIQDFAWAEIHVERRCAERAEHADLPMREPMFCFETALKLLYWSFLVRLPRTRRRTPWTTLPCVLTLDCTLSLCLTEPCSLAAAVYVFTLKFLLTISSISPSLLRCF